MFALVLHNHAKRLALKIISTISKTSSNGDAPAQIFPRFSLCILIGLLYCPCFVFVVVVVYFFYSTQLEASLPSQCKGK